MCVPELSHRLQVLLDDERYERLQRAAAASGASVGELVRRAIDRELPPPAGERRAAAKRLLASTPPAGREPDWEETKRELLDAAGGVPPR